MGGLNDNNAYMDAEKRVKWLNKRINVSSAEFNYIKFQVLTALPISTKDNACDKF